MVFLLSKRMLMLLIKKDCRCFLISLIYSAFLKKQVSIQKTSIFFPFFYFAVYQEKREDENDSRITGKNISRSARNASREK